MLNSHSDRIEALRSMMRNHGWDAVIITGQDPHCSEYPACRWKQVEWLTGFTGEAGDVVVTLDHAGLWTDTRYFIQAEKQLAGTGVELHKTRVPDQVLIPEWLDRWFADESSAIIAVDGLCQCAADVMDFPERFNIISIPNTLDPLWTDRPQIPQTPIMSVETGESRISRIAWLRSVIAEHNCDAMLVTALDEIAWLLNVRASDIEYNPLVISYLLVSQDSVTWFVLKEPVEDPQTDAAFDELLSEGVELQAYADIELALGSFDGRLLVDSASLNYHLSSLLQCDVVSEKSPVQLRKAIKNQYEIDRMRSIHIKDGVAMERFLYWLEKSVQNDRYVTEWDASLKLGQYRSDIPGYQGDSFETISAIGAGAALPHYVSPRTQAPQIVPEGLYLCDSGGQYLDGTTDITRTVPMGPCSALECEDYTLVLKGHIDLSMAVFPAGTAGCQLDILAREPLWSAKRNFGHGTGHGVGFFLGVHEGPQEFRQNFNQVAFRPGMITSVEPGIYREGMHGVRHESLVLCVEDGRNDFGNWLRFETITMCHIDTSIIVKDLLDARETEWLNAYNAKVYRTLSPLLPEDVAEWLRIKTAPI